MSGDIKLFFPESTPETIGTADIRIDGTTLVEDDGIENAIAIALFTDARISDDEAAPGIDNTRGGFFGDAVSGLPMGSLLWTLDAQPITPDTLLKAQEFCEIALQSQIVDEGVAESFEVTVTESGGVYYIEVIIYGPNDTTKLYKFSKNWINQISG